MNKKSKTKNEIENVVEEIKYSKAIGNPRSTFLKDVVVINKNNETYFKDDNDNLIQWSNMSAFKEGQTFKIFGKIKTIKTVKNDEITILNYLVVK